MTLILQFLLMIAVQDVDWPRQYLTVASEYLQNERWLVEIKATSEQRRKIEVWFKRQRAAERIRQEIGDTIRGARDRGDFDEMMELREDYNSHSKSMHTLDQKMIGKILTDSQLVRFRQLIHWHIHGEISARNIVETLGSAPLRNFQPADLKQLIPLRRASREEGKALVKQHELELDAIIERLTSQEIYNRIKARRYTRIKLASPFKSIEVLEYFANQCRHPREKVEFLDGLRKQVTSSINAALPAEISDVARQAVELEALNGIYELVDESISERKFNRLSANFLMKSLTEFKSEGLLNPDAAAYFDLTGERIEVARLQLLECKVRFNERFKNMQHRQLADFHSKMSPESLLNLESFFGDPPGYMLLYYSGLDTQGDGRGIDESN